MALNMVFVSDIIIPVGAGRDIKRAGLHKNELMYFLIPVVFIKIRCGRPVNIINILFPD